MEWLLLVAGVSSLVALWMWFWPTRWWRRVDRVPQIAPQSPLIFVRSLPAFVLAIWSFAGIAWLETAIVGGSSHPNGPTLIVLLVALLLPLVVWLSVFVLGRPVFLLPPNSRDLDPDD
jgi:hypothetical protein